MPKKRVFLNYESKMQFIKNYQKKIKTELCKNWQIKKSCKFGNNVNFFFYK